MNLWFRPKAVVTIDRWATSTDRPQITVGVSSRRGSTSIFTWDANDQGDACASLHGKDLAHILGIPLIDHRDHIADALRVRVCTCGAPRIGCTPENCEKPV